MASRSKKDLTARVQTLEDKIDVVMKSIVISQPSQVIGGSPRSFSLLEWYNAIRAAEIQPEDALLATEILTEEQPTGAEVV
jgi:hypothetical protein